MKMKSISLLSLLLSFFVVGALNAQDHPSWMRYPKISPDASKIAFSFAGDLWVVSSHGGQARLLTSHDAHEFHPVWSPDSQWIAFASDRHGNFDVFTISAEGGKSKRITFHSASDIPESFTRDGKKILFSSNRQDAPEALIGGQMLGELYSISTNGGRPLQVLTTPALDAVPSPDGRYLAFHDHKGFEDPWRKHHTSSITRDIWLWDSKNDKHTKLTNFKGEDRNPVWTNDGKTIFYLSERSGTFNIWQMNPRSPEDTTQVTTHRTHPVRFLSIAENGTMCYGYNGEIWVKNPESAAHRIAVNAVMGARHNPVKLLSLKTGATEMAVSPNEEEVAFVVRGEVYVVSTKHGTTKRITKTPQQERSLTWTPDGRTLYYASERNNSWNLYKSTIASKDEDRFYRSTLVSEEPVLVTDDETFQPQMSPDGKKLAYIHNRDSIHILDLASMKTQTIVPASVNYSYEDGDIGFDWSPDSKWLSFTYNGFKRWINDIGVVDVATGKITNISASGYAESGPSWSSDSKALLFISDRFGRRSHGGWGSDNDVIAFYLNQKAFDRTVLSKEDFEKLLKDEKEAKKKKKTDGKEVDHQKNAQKETQPLEIDFLNKEYRQKRLTLSSAPISSYALSPDGETLVYFAQVESRWDLWVSKMRDSSTFKILSLKDSRPGSVEFAKDGKSVFVARGGGMLAKVAIASAKAGGKASMKPISYNAEMTVNLPAERKYMFEHIWRQVKQKFYREDLHGVDWVALKKNYMAFLPTITDNNDFSEMLSEMLGELNASHTGSRYRPRSTSGDSTAALGILFDLKYQGKGMKVGEVLTRGPVDRAKSKIGKGTIVTHIDGVELTPDVNPYQLLNRKSGKRIRLALRDITSGEKWDEVVKPVSRGATRGLLYQRWIEICRKKTEKFSQGRIGYVHIRSMNDDSFRHFFDKVLGRNSDKEALIVDTRWNGGGWLHDDLVSFLSGKDYIQFVPRGKKRGQLGAEPQSRWSRPTVVLQNESNYSDGHMFPFAFKELKLGKLVGAPVPGTGTAVWWEHLIDPSIIFGIPEVGMLTKEGNFLENTQLEPDILVINDPESMSRGLDLQLKKAVDELLNQLDSKKK